MLIRQKLSDYLLSITRFSRIISITGAGGKTTLLNFLASIYAPLGKKIMLTTTTHLAKEVKYNVDEIITGPLSYSGKGNVLYINEADIAEKYASPGEDNIKNLSRYFDIVIIEADGSAGLALKYHRETEPVIIPDTNITFSLLSLDAIGRDIRDVMHISEGYFSQFPEREGKRAGLIDYENLYYSKNGIFKGTSADKCTVILNKADAIADPVELKKIVSFAAKIDALVVSIEKNTLFCDSSYSF